MPIYKVTDKATSKVHVVSATSQPQALRHVSMGMFEIKTLENPTEVAELMDSGIKLEVAGKDDSSPEGSSGEEEQDKS